MRTDIKKDEINSIIEPNYRNAVECAEILVWNWDLDNNIFVFSDRWTDIIGNENTGVKSIYDFISKFAVEKDKKSAKNDLDYYLNGNSLKYRSEFRIIDGKGNYKWILIKGNMLHKTENRKIFCGTITDVSEIKMFEEEVRNLAYFDSLTELPNRNLFKYDFMSTLAKSKCNSGKGALIFIDIDNFKRINDIFGHDYGDILLKVFSQILCICIKNQGKAYRLSGDEFAIIMDSYNSKEEINRVCRNIMEACKEPFEVKDELICISVSVGIVAFPENSTDVNELFKFADLAMYNSKKHGKNCCTFFNNEIYQVYSRKILIERELKSAIDENELYIMYQPQVDMKSNRIIGFEALIRWNSRKLGNISPAEFIPIAEKNGDIVNIGEWVLKEVCKRIRYLSEKGYDFGTISVNISPIQLKKNNFVDAMIDICKENSIQCKHLQIEITEGTIIDLYTENILVLNKIIENGFKISIDDFGTGYSSLNYLTILPISTLKIDKSFIDNIYKDKNRAVTKCIIELSEMLRYEVIAEGVEDKEQMKILEELGCNRIQGYYYSKPINEYEMEKMLTKKEG